MKQSIQRRESHWDRLKQLATPELVPLIKAWEMGGLVLIRSDILIQAVQIYQTRRREDDMTPDKIMRDFGSEAYWCGQLEKAPAFTFLSHAHCSDRERSRVFKKDPGNLVTEYAWLDLACMGQSGPEWYDYNAHTAPTVARLDRIMLKASRSVIMLDGLEETSITNRVGVSTWANGLHALRQLFFAAEAIEGKNPDIRGLSERVNGFILEYPTDRYFERLWCFVERLAIMKDRLQVTGGSGGLFDVHEMERLFDEVVEQYAREFPRGASIMFHDTTMGASFLDPETLAGLKTKAVSDIANLYGISHDSDEYCGALEQIYTLKCYCDADRVDVMLIETRLRGKHIQVEEIGVLERMLGSKPVGCGIACAGIGKTRQVGACLDSDGKYSEKIAKSLGKDSKGLVQVLQRAASRGQAVCFCSNSSRTEFAFELIFPDYNSVQVLWGKSSPHALLNPVPNYRDLKVYQGWRMENVFSDRDGCKRLFKISKSTGLLQKPIGI